jgi:HAMP domain-containing protein
MVSPEAMRVALKLVLATVLGTLAVLVIFGWLRARREIELFDSDMRRDHLLVGTTLAVCVADEWAAAGQDRAMQLVKEADEERPHMRLGFVHPDGTQSDVAPGRASRHEVVDRLEHFITTELDEPDEEFLVTRVPVHGRHRELLGAVEIAERLGIRQEFLRSNLVGTLAATLAMVGFSGCVVLLMGVWLVGRPLNMLAAKAKRIGEGDLSGPLSLVQRDEIGQLGTEVNAMCERLAEANARSQAETSARINAMEQLRHADRLITVGRLAAGIAHELGTPLNVIGGGGRASRAHDRHHPPAARLRRTSRAPRGTDGPACDRPRHRAHGRAHRTQAQRRGVDQLRRQGHGDRRCRAARAGVVEPGGERHPRL